MRKKVVLKSSVFLWQTSTRGLMYNCASAAHLQFSLEDPGIMSLCRQWGDLDNLYAAYYDGNDGQSQTAAFVQTVADRGFGVVCDGDERVVSFPPVLKINKSVERKEVWGGLEALPMLPYLTRLRVFLGGLSDSHSLWKQSMYPMDSSERLEAERLLGFMQRCDPRSLAHIELVVSDWDEAQLSGFYERLSDPDQKKKVRFYFAHPDPGFNNAILKRLASDGFAVTQVCLPSRLDKVGWISGRDYQLLVRSEEEYACWEDLLGDDSSISYEVMPVADSNPDFFRKNIFLSKEEILSQKITKKEIFRHQALNAYHFGSFYIFPDGTVHPAADAPAIGTLEDSVHSLIIRELEENHAWRRTRRLMEPCKDCLYHDLCPSPTAYERVLGIPACTVGL